MVNMQKRSGVTVQYVNEYVADTAADIEKLKTENAAPGSTCVCIEDSSVYMLGGDYEWHKL